MLAVVRDFVDESSEEKNSLDLVISELESNLVLLESNYNQVLTNLQYLKTQVETDELTRLLRRGAFLKKMQRLLDESKVKEKTVHIMMIDVDHFKHVNDSHGHQTGDDVLVRVGSLIQNYLSPKSSMPEAFAGRYGGEEVIIAIQAEHEDALVIAEKIRSTVRENKMLSRTNKEFNVTLSIGLASSKVFGHDIEELISQADMALYNAKNSGRDRVSISG